MNRLQISKKRRAVRCRSESATPWLSKRRGLILLVVLVVIVLMTLSVYTFTDLMLAHRQSIDLSTRRDQATAMAESGVDAIRWFLMQDETVRADVGGEYDNPIYFQAQPVLLGQTLESRGNFTVISPALDEYGMIGGSRYGLQDESARLNINTLLLADKIMENGGRTLLMTLPGMTEETADAILDWIDPDDDPREFGAEYDFYQQLTPPYTTKNGPLDTVEELLLVRGVAPQLLFGLDTNRNAIVDSHEMVTSNNASMDPAFSPLATGIDGDPSTAIGWASYLTLYSQESNTNTERLPRVYLNQDDMEQLYQELSEILPADWATFIVAYRQNGPSSETDPGESGIAAELDLSMPGQTTLTQVLDLFDKRVEVQFLGTEEPIILESPFVNQPISMAFYLPTLMDNVTVNSSPIIPGRININRAPRTILLGIPSMTEEIVDQIIQQRDLLSDDEAVQKNRRHETWIMAGSIVTLDEMRTLTPLICGGGDVFRAQIVGYFEDGTAASRLEVIFDATYQLPRILSWRKMTHLGRGYPLDLLGVQWLDASQP